MVLLRRRNKADGQGSYYEDLRERRIKENNERMQKLGIFDLSLKLKSHHATTTKTSPYQKRLKPLPLSTSPRRSSRLKSVNPVNYSTFHTRKKEGSSKDLEIWREEGSKPVDGYGKDGKRIYDPEKGETCHQCRQKTFRLHTHCSTCKTGQGQFCGGCLYTRYGENVIEVNENATWVCPVCRGICNCSRCRKAKGLAPTGYIYRKVLKLGFKSVAHYFQTQQVITQPEDIGEILDSRK